MQEKPTDGGIYWLNLRYTDEQCPGMREILASAPMDQQSALVRGILYQWCLIHKQSGTLEQAMINVLNGPGVNGRRRRRKDGSPSDAERSFVPKRPVAAKPDQAPTLAAPSPEMPAPVPAPLPVAQPQPETSPNQAVPSSAADNLFSMFD